MAGIKVRVWVGRVAALGMLGGALAVAAPPPVLLRFRLGGFQGDDPASTPPSVQRTDCATGTAIGAPFPAALVNGLSPAFARVTGYTYGWSTERGWRRTCATFTLSLADGTTHQASFRFG